MIYETGFLNSVNLHPDGRITMHRAMPREGIFLHIEFTPKELEAIDKALRQRAAQTRA